MYAEPLVARVVNGSKIAIVWPLAAKVFEKSPCRCKSVGMVGWCCRKSARAGPHTNTMKKVLSRRMGPLTVPPNWLRLKLPSAMPFLIGKEVVRIQRGVAQELVGAAVQLVRSGLEDHVEHAALAAPELRRVVRAHHLEFGDGIDRRGIWIRPTSR